MQAGGMWPKWISAHFCSKWHKREKELLWKMPMNKESVSSLIFTFKNWFSFFMYKFMYDMLFNIHCLIIVL